MWWFHIIMQKQTKENKQRHLLCCGCAGAKFHAWLAVPEEVEDHCPGLHLFPSCWEHEKKEPDCLQHGGGGDGIRPPTLHPGELFPQAASHGCQLQETSHQPWWRQQYIPQQVQLSSFECCVTVNFLKIFYLFVYSQSRKHIQSDLRPVLPVSSETIMFLHEIFHQGLKARIANWPTLVLGEYCRDASLCSLHILADYNLQNNNMVYIMRHRFEPRCTSRVRLKDK